MKPFSFAKAVLKDREDKALAELRLSISSEVQRLMKERDLNQNELSEKLGLNKSYVSRLLNGKLNMTIETLAKIGKEFGIVWTLGHKEVEDYKKRATFRNQNYEEFEALPENEGNIV